LVGLYKDSIVLELSKFSIAFWELFFTAKKPDIEEDQRPFAGFSINWHNTRWL